MDGCYWQEKSLDEYLNENYQTVGKKTEELKSLFIKWQLYQCEGSKEDKNEDYSKTIASWENVKKIELSKKKSSSSKNFYERYRERTKQIIDEEKIKRVEHQFCNSEKSYIDCSKGIFCVDGIINEEEYMKAPYKVLFLTNESNFYGYCFENLGDRIQDFRNYKIDGNDFGGNMMGRICSLYLSLICFMNKENTETATTYDNVKELATSFAFMNLNKRGGTNNIGPHLVEYCHYYKNEIEEEIKIINPDIIIWLGCNSFDMLHSSFGIEKNDFKYCYNIEPSHKIPVIRMYHTCHYRFRKKSIEKMQKLIKKNNKEAFVKIEKIDNITIKNQSIKLLYELSRLC